MDWRKEISKGRRTSHHRSEVWVVENVAVVVDSEWVAVDPKLENGAIYWTPISLVSLSLTLYGGMSFSISAMGTSVPATPRSSAIRTWAKVGVNIMWGGEGGADEDNINETKQTQGRASLVLEIRLTW